MKLKIILALVVIGAMLAWQAGAQIYDTNNVVVQTFAGSGFTGLVDGQGTLTMFNSPMAVVADSSSNLFVLDKGNARIRKITPDGAVTTFAGGGGSMTGYGTNASVGLFGSMTIDHSNVLWLTWNLSDYPSSTLVRIGSDAYVSRTNLSGITHARGICVDSANNIYVSDVLGNKIYRWRTNGALEVFAGSGNNGSVDGNGIFTSFSGPSALAADAADNIYVWDSGSGIRRINQNRDVVTIVRNNSSDSDGVGTNASFSSFSGMCVDSLGNVIVACDSSVRKMTATTNVTTLAGSFTQTAYTNGPGNLARFSGAIGVCVSQGMIFVADSNNERVRNITFNPSSEVVSPANLQLNNYPGLQIVGTVGRTFQIQVSPDLNTWSTVATVLLTSSPYLWIDQNPINGKKFYRALLLP